MLCVHFSFKNVSGTFNNLCITLEQAVSGMSMSLIHKVTCDSYLDGEGTCGICFN